MEMRFRSYAMLLSATMLLASCAGEDPWKEAGGGKGTIVLNLTVSSDLDNLTTQGRAGETAVVPNFPTVDQFSIRLTPVGGEPVEYKTVAEFEENMEAGVKAGAYTLEAYFGDPLDQDDKPYVYGKQQLRVSEQAVSQVDITARLANSLVEVTYTDAFKSYFKDYSTTLKSDKNSAAVTIAGIDGASKFVTPGFINVTMAATYINGKEAHLNPKNFSAQEAFLYRVKYDVNAGQIGSPTLSITFDDNIDEVETVEVDLSNDFFSAAPPEVTAEGFNPGETISAKVGSYSGDPLRFNISAEGKIAEVLLSVTSSGTESPYAPSFGTSVNLFKADASLQEKLKAEGITAVGLFNNTDKLAMVDVTGFINRLPEGSHEISLIVKDAKTRVSEPVSLTFTTIPVTLKATNSPVRQYDREEVELNVSYDGGDLSLVSFKTVDERGMDVPCVAGSPVDKGGDNYVYTLRLPVDRRASQPVTLYYNGRERETVNVDVAWADPTFAYDAYTKTAYVKVDGFSDAFIDIVKEKSWLEIKDASSAIVPEYDAANKWFVYSGLTPGKEYSIFVRDGVYSPKFSTEAATDVPNGDFSQVHETINMSDVKVGGDWLCGAIAYHNKSSIKRNEADGWASINSKTCSSLATNNTWFRVPSTYVENNGCVIRSVAFDLDGVEPARTGKFTSTTHYCTNVPTFKDEDKAAGELFLGSYSFTASGEVRNEGIAHSSRPSSMSFQYTYSGMSGEKAKVAIEILDNSGNIISSGIADLGSSESKVDKVISLPEYGFGAKADKIKIKFLSSDRTYPQVNVPTGNDLNDGGGLRNETFDANKYKSVAIGSVLTIYNVKLHYDK